MKNTKLIGKLVSILAIIAHANVAFVICYADMFAIVSFIVLRFHSFTETSQKQANSEQQKQRTRMLIVLLRNELIMII